MSDDFVSLLEGFELHGWKPDGALSVDENMMDLVGSFHNGHPPFVPEKMHQV